MSNSQEQNRMSYYEAEEEAGKIIESIGSGESTDYNEAEKIVEEKERLKILEEVLSHIKDVLNRGGEQFNSSNMSYFLVKQLGLDELGLDLARIGIAEFIEKMKDTNIKDRSSYVFPPDHIIHGNIAHEHIFATNPYYSLRQRNYEIPKDLEVICEKIEKLAIASYLLRKQYAIVARYYRADGMTDKADEMMELHNKYQGVDPKDQPDLHLSPPLKEALLEFWENIKDNPYIITKGNRLKILEDLEKKVEAEIDKVKNLPPNQ